MASFSSPSIVCWQETYRTGDDRIDQDHKVLFELVTSLQAAIQASASSAHLKMLLQVISEHTAEHFQHEEALMLKYRYDGYSRHKQVHDQLLKKVSRLLSQFEQSDILLIENLTNFLTEWLAHHIRGEDQNMIDFLRKRHHF